MAVTKPPTGSLRANHARRVRAARGWANLTQPELAQQLDMSVASVRRIEQENRDVSVAELTHIARVCDVPESFMLHGWGEASTDTLEAIIADMSRRVERHEKIHKAALARLAKLDGGEVDVLIVDEAHHGGAAAFEVKSVERTDLMGDLEESLADTATPRRRRKAS
jgi:transcriptional regulator with XRE-family HTH domain